MNFLALFLCTLSLQVHSIALQDAAAVKPAGPPVADPKDVDTVDHIMSALYDVISGPAGQARNWDRMRSLFVPGAKMGAVFETATGALREVDFTVDRYIESSGPVLVKDGFFEHETHRSANTYRHIAKIFSSYESRIHPKDKPFEKGVNSLDLYTDGKRWWIRSIFWEGEVLDPNALKR